MLRRRPLIKMRDKNGAAGMSVGSYDIEREASTWKNL